MSIDKKITVIGGGTGTSVVLSELKQNQGLDLSAVIVVSDSGGSTGRLRDEFGFPAVGDLRQCLAALADGKHQEDVRDLLLYRFNKGQGLKGHNLGNLILTALEDIKENTNDAIKTATDIFKTRGSIYPVTEKSVQLVIKYEDGTVRLGESALDDSKFGGNKIDNITLSPNAEINPLAAQAIKKADLVVLGPGDLYASLIPNSLVKGFKKSLRESESKFVYILNLMTHYSQTHDMSASQHLNEVTKYFDKQPDVVIINNGLISDSTLKSYAKQKEYPVIDDLQENSDYQIIRDDFVSKVAVQQKPHDKVVRSFLRHDGKKLALKLQNLL